MNVTTVTCEPCICQQKKSALQKPGRIRSQGGRNHRILYTFAGGHLGRFGAGSGLGGPLGGDDVMVKFDDLKKAGSRWARRWSPPLTRAST